MESHQGYLQQAEECERQATTCEVEENRKRAEEARAKAEVAQGEGARDALLQEANTWNRMSDWEDKNNPIRHSSPDHRSG